MTALIKSPLLRVAVSLVSAACFVFGLMPQITASKCCPGEPTSALPDSSKEARLRAIIADQVVAWNVGDAKAFAVSFAEDGSFTNIRRTLAYGRCAFEDRHTEIFQTIFKGIKLTMLPPRIRFVRPDVAIVDIDCEVRDIASVPPGVKATADGRIRIRLQEVFVKNDGKWQIESYYNVDMK